MRYGSVCSGIEAASVAWHPLGWRAQWLAEIEKFPSAVLAHHYPDVPNLGDMTKIHESEVFRGSAIDLLVGGTPCQSFSVAGLRKGLDDPRGNLALEFLRLADLSRARWVVWENVPGVLSSNGGRDFGSFLGALGQLGYGFAYRVLDAQFFGVAQRRRRVFVVGCLGDWRRAAAVLFERHSLSGHPAPSRNQGAGVAALTASGVGTCGADDNQAQAGHKVPSFREAHGVSLRGREGGATAEVTEGISPTIRASTGGGDKPHVLIAPPLAGCITAREGKGPDSDVTTTLIAFDTTQITSSHNRSNPQAGDTGHPLAAGAHPPTIAFRPTGGSQGIDAHVNVSPTLKVGSGGNSGQPPGVMGSMGVRRLTPKECERLQGFDDDYTLIPWRGGLAADGPRYKALGNSMAVPVMRWIGERIQQVDTESK